MYSFLTNLLEPLSYLIYLVIVVVIFKYDKSSQIKTLLFYYSFTLVCMIIISAKVYLQQNNIWLYDIVALGGIICFGRYFYLTLKTKIKKNISLFLVIVNIAYAIYRHFIVRDYQLFDSIEYVILSATVVFLSLFYIHDFFYKMDEKNVIKTPDFWLVSFYLIYFLGSFVIFLTFEYFTNKILESYTVTERNILTLLWGYHNVLLFFCAIASLTGILWKCSPKK